MRFLIFPVNRPVRALPRRRDFTVIVYLAFSVTFPFSFKLLFPFLESDSFQQLNPIIDVHHLWGQENTREIPPKKWPEKEFLLEGPSQTVGGQVYETTQTIRFWFSRPGMLFRAEGVASLSSCLSVLISSSLTVQAFTRRSLWFLRRSGLGPCSSSCACIGGCA
jgi:hypothetical protein